MLLPMRPSAGGHNKFQRVQSENTKDWIPIRKIVHKACFLLYLELEHVF